MCWVPDLIPFAKKHNIVLQAYSSLGSGESRLLDHPVVKEVRHTCTTASLPFTDHVENVRASFECVVRDLVGRDRRDAFTCVGRGLGRV